MRLFTKSKQHDTEALDILLQSVVSVYLYMAKTAKLSGSEINVIDRILRSMFGNEIALFKIEQARQNSISIRDAANQLNEYISTADKLKLILNLIALAYHDREKIHVLGSVEIVEMVDLLRIDVNLLNSIYDVFEGKTDTLELPYDSFCEVQKHYIRNSMAWAKSQADFVLNHCNSTFIFLMIEDLVFVGLDQTDTSCMTSLANAKKRSETELLPKLFYRMTKESILRFHYSDRELNLSFEDLWTLYKLQFSTELITIPTTAGILRKLRYNAGKFSLQAIENKLNFKARELALDDIAEELDTHKSIATLLTQKDERSRDSNLISDHWLELRNKKYRLTTNSESNTLLHFYHNEQTWMLKNTSEQQIFLNRQLLSDEAPFSFNNDIISIDSESYIINRNWELIEIPLEIKELIVEEIYHRFSQEKLVAIDSVAFNLKQGSMMAIMGPSGSGKTTLLKILLGEINAERARIRIDGIDFISNYSFFQQYIGYVPQDDLLFANLTVYENLFYNLRLRLPRISDKEEIQTRIDNLLKNVGLFEQRNMIVGDVMHKKLSGGQRRRLNIALELISNPMIIILDEPTSGLSSKDSENITQFLSELKEQGKIILCTIHQPNATIFKQFDQILLLDKGGTEVFFGSTAEVFEYFDLELKGLDSDLEKLQTKKELIMPEYFFDLIELTDIYSQRRFPPSYWKQKYRDYRFRQALDPGKMETEELLDQFTKTSVSRKASSFTHLKLLVRRNFKNKMRSKINLLMTLGVAPLLAFFTSIILRSTPMDVEYSFYENSNFLLFAFISVIIFIFIGLANSIDDILGEKRIILREKKMNISVTASLNSKILVLFCMTLIQSLLYYVIAALVLGMRGSFLPMIGSLLCSGIMGYSFGLLASSLIHDRSAIINILPLIIIPQIMFSGAVIQFADMNRALKFSDHSEIPEFCHLIPSRWLYEGMVLAQYHYNQHSITQAKYTSLFKNDSYSPQQRSELIKIYGLRLEKMDEKTHVNQQSSSYIRKNHGKYLNEDRNFFLCHTIKLFGKEHKTLYLDIIVLALMLILINSITWIKIRHFYE